MFTLTMFCVYGGIYLHCYFSFSTSNNALTTPCSILCTHWTNKYKFIYKSQLSEHKEDGQLNNLLNICENCLPGPLRASSRRQVGEAYFTGCYKTNYGTNGTGDTVPLSGRGTAVRQLIATSELAARHLTLYAFKLAINLLLC